MSEGLSEVLAHLVSGHTPRSEVERDLLEAWNALGRLERYAVSARLNLPYTSQVTDDRLADAVLPGLEIIVRPGPAKKGKRRK